MQQQCYIESGEGLINYLGEELDFSVKMGMELVEAFLSVMLCNFACMQELNWNLEFFP